MTITPADALHACIFTLQFATVTEDAERILSIAAARGVDPATLTALRAEWDALQARTVQVIGGEVA
jgi:hypothetical protein